jgi:hypothetical protein
MEGAAKRAGSGSELMRIAPIVTPCDYAPDMA